MKPTVTVVRAIGAEFARRLVKPLMLAGAIAAIALLSLSIWLVVSVNAWWWLLLVPVIMATLLFIALVVAAQVAIRLTSPEQSKVQRTAVRGFVDKLQRVAENFQTPQFMILFRVVRDTIRPRTGGFIETVSRDSKTLAPDFAALLRQFS